MRTELKYAEELKRGDTASINGKRLIKVTSARKLKDNRIKLGYKKPEAGTQKVKYMNLGTKALVETITW